ncbi:GNAT family N-acetyltransferase [Carnobacterium sp. TMP28]|uniref:GNAT family N-acetyltransferase n=1 Tax=Carnobacterium sp. TMP28 TaxID=3397060 RepID=UPI0039DF7C08
MHIEQIYEDIPILKTDRLILRKITIQDLDDMFEYASDKEVAQYVTWSAHKTISDTRNFIEDILDKYQKKQIAPWGIELKDNGKFIGTIDFVSWQTKNNCAEIGYALSKKYWGKGLVTEATKEIMAFGFNKMDLVRIQAKCISDNIASSKVMKKNGMVLEGTMRQSYLRDKVYKDMDLYAILKEEYKPTKP